jgi:SH3 domain-containing YSC84-like protein 1
MIASGFVSGRGIRRATAKVLLGLVLVFGAQGAHAVEEYRMTELVERARTTLDLMNADQNMQQFRAYVPYAHALLIVPSYIKGALVVGAAGGMGVLIRRDEATGRWSSPAFYSLRSASVGLQLGGSSSEMILIFQTEKGLELLDKTSIKLGADASVAAGNRGYGVEGATPTNFSTDIAAFARAKGAFMGASLSGTSMVVKHEWNNAYYGRAVTPREILEGQVRSPKAEALSQAAARFFADNARGD